jgi:sodium/bile acid cotransporter 7
MSIRAAIAKLPIDPYLLLLIATVGLAWILPAEGKAAGVADASVNVAVATLFFLYGARLSPSAIWAGLTHWRLQTLVFASTYLLFPVIGVALNLMLRGHIAPEAATGLLFVCLLPSTVQSSIAFTSIARGNVPAALCAASVSNMAGVVMTPALVALLLPAASGGLSAHALIDIACQILLPFLAGQVARRWIVDWLLRHPVLTAVVDRGSVLLVVYAAFSAGTATGVWARVSLEDVALILMLDLVILGLVLVTTTAVSRRLGFSTEDEIAIVFCGSKKSMAGGIPMASILFPGHAVSLIVLPLMLFHQAQLFACATLARRYDRRAAPAPSARRPSDGVLGLSSPSAGSPLADPSARLGG